MSARPKLLDQHGRELKMFYSTAHEASDRGSRELGSFNPGTFSADGEWLGEMEAARDRLDDLIRNNGIASGAVQTHIDNTIGSGLLLNCRPDRKALGVADDDEKMNEELDDLENTIEAKFDAWAEDVGCYVDASRRCRLSGLMAQGYRSYLGSFEITATAEWLKRTGTMYRTAIQMIDPRRLCNPLGERDSDKLRGGVKLGDMGEPVGYWFVSHIQGEPTGIDGSAFRTWRLVPRETPWGRQQVLHVYDVDKPGRSRGKSGVLSVLAAHKMHEKWTKASVEAAIFNSLYAAYIQSSLDWSAVAQAIGAGEENLGAVDRYFEGLNTYHKSGHVRFNGQRVMHLYPGEKFKHIAPSHPAPQFEAFERAANRRLAAGWNLTYPQISRDYSQSNYSSDRAALLEVWRFFNSRQYHIAGRFSGMVYALWLEEAIELGEVVLPAGLPDFYEAKTAWLGCDWIGPGRGHIDLLKEANGTKVWKSMGVETMESIAASQGKRWRKLVDQRAQEERYMKKRGLDPKQFDGEGIQQGEAQEVDKDGNPVGDPVTDSGAAPGDDSKNAKTRVVRYGDRMVASGPNLPPIVIVNQQPATQVSTNVDMSELASAVRAAGETRRETDAATAQQLDEIADGLTILADGTKAQVQALGQSLAKELSRPTVLVRDAKGKTVGAVRVDKLPGGGE